jgi:hypothetical protein
MGLIHLEVLGSWPWATNTQQIIETQQVLESNEQRHSGWGSSSPAHATAGQVVGAQHMCEMTG